MKSFIVLHANSLRFAADIESLEDLAAFEAEGDYPAVAIVKLDVDEVNVASLEKVFELTNNIEGSWSRGETFEYNGEVFENPDYDERIELTKPLEAGLDGVVRGLRSTSSGDVIIADGKYWLVDVIGFRELKPKG